MCLSINQSINQAATAVRPEDSDDDYDADAEEGPYRGEPLADEEYLTNYT